MDLLESKSTYFSWEFNRLGGSRAIEILLMSNWLFTTIILESFYVLFEFRFNLFNGMVCLTKADAFGVVIFCVWRAEQEPDQKILRQFHLGLSTLKK